MKINIVNDMEHLLNKGDVMVIFNEILNYDQLAIICPGCGKLSGTNKKHRWNVATQTYSPSIVHNKELGGCGWHGTITNGIITSA